MPDLRSAATDNLVTHFTWVQQQTAGMHADRGPYVVLTDSGLACDTFNAVCRARFTAETATDQIKACIDHFAQAHRPFSWWLSPGDEPPNLAALLRDAGLREADSELAMAANLKGLPTAELTPDGLEIRRVRSEADLSNFARVLSGMWTPPDPEVIRFYQLAAPVILRPDSPLWLYVGYVDGTAAATAEITVANGVGGLYNICTLPAFRRRGYGSAMTLKPLIDARASGCATAILQATEEGARVYKRLGFETFGLITEYKPPA